MKYTSQCQSTQLLRKVTIITGHSAAVCYRKNSTAPVDQIGDENSTRRELQAFTRKYQSSCKCDLLQLITEESLESINS